MRVHFPLTKFGERCLLSAFFLIFALASNTALGEDPNPDKFAQAGLAQSSQLAPAILAAISYHPDLFNTPFTNGDGIQGTTASANILNPDTWEYYRFCANEGDTVTIETHRTKSAMDPTQMICQGTTGPEYRLRWIWPVRARYELCSLG